MFDTSGEALLEHHHGVLRLLALKLGSRLRDLRKHHGLSATGLMAWSSTGSGDTLVEGLVESSLALTAGNSPAGIRDETAFLALQENTRAGLGPVFRKQSAYLDRVLKTWAEVSNKLDDTYYHQRPDVFNDMRSQLDDMVYEGFVQELSPSRLGHYPRYLEAMSIRLASVEKDRSIRWRYMPEPMTMVFWKRHTERLTMARLPVMSSIFQLSWKANMSLRKPMPSLIAMASL